MMQIFFFFFFQTGKLVLFVLVWDLAVRGWLSPCHCRGGGLRQLLSSASVFLPVRAGPDEP